MNPSLGRDRDELLMFQVAQGQTEMLEPLVRRYGTLLLSFICRMVHDRQRSEDLFQDVFITVWRKRAQYHFPSPFKPWLYAIAINRVRQVLRRRNRIVLLPENGTASIESTVAQASPFASVLATETTALVQEAVALLPPKRQIVVTMRIWNDFSYSEIAEALGVREVTVRSNMRDALIAIRRYLEPRM